jgi:hypothetical protein
MWIHTNQRQFGLPLPARRRDEEAEPVMAEQYCMRHHRRYEKRIQDIMTVQDLVIIQQLNGARFPTLNYRSPSQLRRILLSTK